MIKFTEDLSNILVTKRDRVFIIDANVYKLYKKLFASMKKNTRIYFLDATEQNKNLEFVSEIYEFFLKNNVNRKTLIIGVGGGITTDITAFAASTYKRGCGLILIPTTLLAMVDAAIGGKTGVNFINHKNNIGSFYEADEIIINFGFLESLPQSILNEGFVEIVKMSFLSETNLPVMLNADTDIEELIKEAIKAKQAICKIDHYDKNKRNLLNLGHTFGHVLESVSNYNISHGTAVALGIRAAAKYSFLKGFINKNILTSINARLDKHKLPNTYNSKYVENILADGENILKQDKKADDQLKLVLFRDIQNLFIFKTEFDKEILNILKGFADD